MAIRIEGKNTKYIDPLVTGIVEFVIKDYKLFELLVEVINEMHTPDKFNEKSLNYIVEDSLEKEKITEEEAKKFLDYMKQLYLTSDTDLFVKRRGHLTEYLAYQLGPIFLEDYTSSLGYKYDMKVYEENTFIGQNICNCDFDIGLYDPLSLDSVSTLVAELYECKTILDTFLYYSDQKDPPIKRKNYNKLAFMNYNGSHFSLNNNVAVCIITLQKNSFRAKNILEELKFLFIKIVDGEELHKVLKKKLSINRLKVIKSV